MASLAFGLSVHHFVSSVGADVGFASLIAVAILVLLYFAQARETATLRARADEAGLRVQELEDQLASLAEQVAALPAEISVRAASPRAAAAYGTVNPGAGVPAGGGALTMLPPSAPAGVAAPALAAATRLIPDPELPEYPPVTAAGNGNGGSARPVVAASAATVERPVQARTAGPPRPVAAPPQGGGPGARGSGGASGRVVGSGPGGRPPGAGQVRPAGQGRPPGPGQPRYAGPARPATPRRSRGRLVLGALAGALALAAAVVVGLLVLSGGKASSSASKSAASASLVSHHATSPAAVRPADVTVSVLNGTDMVGLAGRVSQRLLTDGYRKGSVTNASDQTQASTVVAYMAPAYRPEAIAVATALKLAQSAVQPIDPNTKAIACPPNQACTSAVVVTVGKDLAAQ